MAIDRERVQRMSAAGMSNREIGRELGCSYEQVRRILAQEGKLDITPVTFRATDEGILILTKDHAVVATAVKRALTSAGIAHKNEEA